MKLSARKRAQIYDLIHEHLMKERLAQRELFKETGYHFQKANHIDYRIAQLEAPLAQAIFKLLDKDYK